MNREQNPAPHFQGSQGNDDTSGMPATEPGLCVTVIATTEEGTACALYAARGLAKDLDPAITVLKMEVVPDRFALHGPPGSFDFSIKRHRLLMRPTGAREEGVAIRVCRDLDSGLQSVLRRGALVVIGGRRHWWLSSEERLEKSLRRMGHHVIFIDVDHMADRISAGRCVFHPGSGSGHCQKQPETAD